MVSGIRISHGDNEDEINALTHDQLRSLFWQTYGWMSVHNKTEMDKAVSSALDEIKNIEEIINR